MMIRLLLCAVFFNAAASAPAEELKSIFNGEDLTGWAGRDDLWRVEDGAIVGETTADKPIEANTFLVWEEGEVADFEFTCEVRFQGNNSGVQYRSEVVGDPADFALRGYQADLHPKQEYFGMLYGEKYGKRGIIATRGQKAVAREDKDVEVTGEVGDGAILDGASWNRLRIVAVGNRLIHLVNGVVTVDVTDLHPESMAAGKLGLQLHRGEPMKVEFRELQLRRLSGEEAAGIIAEAAASHGGDGAAESD